jgi:flagellar motility protein MotE (MotC chaperone)
MTGFLLRSLRDVRLVPVVMIATIALFALKALGLVLDGGYLFDNLSDLRDRTEITGTIGAPDPAALQPPGPNPANPAALKPAVSKPPRKPSWAQEMFNFPDATGTVGSPPVIDRTDITGSAEETKSPKKEGEGEGAAKKPLEPPLRPNGTPVPLESDRPVSPAERAILESLQKRRAELDARARELDVREDLLRAAEKRVGGRIDELKDIEARVTATLQQKDEGETSRFKNVVTMYENMKAKDAAKIFDGLDIRVLLDVAKEINPRRMSDILALMTPENAQRLTIELAARSTQKDPTQAAELPKIQGKPTPN